MIVEMIYGVQEMQVVMLGSGEVMSIHLRRYFVNFTFFPTCHVAS